MFWLNGNTILSGLSGNTVLLGLYGNMILFGLNGNTIGAQKPTKSKRMPLNRLVMNALLPKGFMDLEGTDVRLQVNAIPYHSIGACVIYPYMDPLGLEGRGGRLHCSIPT